MKRNTIFSLAFIIVSCMANATPAEERDNILNNWSKDTRTYNHLMGSDGIDSVPPSPGCYGTGKHAGFRLHAPSIQPVVTSRLEKGGAIYEVSTKDGWFVDLSRRSKSDGDLERLFTLTPFTRISCMRGSGKMLVDVAVEADAMSFLMADESDFWCFQLRRKPLPPVPAGSYLLPPVATNSGNWYLFQIVPLFQLGLSWSDGACPDELDSVKLVGLNSLEYVTNKSPFSGGPASKISRIDFSCGQPMGDGNPLIAGHPGAVFPNSQKSEMEIISVFHSGGDDPCDAAYKVLQIEGGEEKLISVLDQFQNQVEAARIKALISESMTALDQKEKEP